MTISNKSMTDIIMVSNVCKQFGVRGMIREDHDISKERKAELFLVGAVFGDANIQGVNCKFMIHNDVMHLLEVKPYE